MFIGRLCASQFFTDVFTYAEELLKTVGIAKQWHLQNKLLISRNVFIIRADTVLQKSYVRRTKQRPPRVENHCFKNIS